MVGEDERIQFIQIYIAHLSFEYVIIHRLIGLFILIPLIALFSKSYFIFYKI